jgi:hypothetical protein
MPQMVSAEVQAAAAILTIRIDHPADIAKAPVDLPAAVRVIAQRRHAVSDIPPVLTFSD